MMPLKRKKNRSGVAAVELAVLAPFLVFLFVVTVDFARVFVLGLAFTDANRFLLPGRSLGDGWIQPSHLRCL